MKKILSIISCIFIILILSSCSTQERLKIIDIKLTEEEYAYILKKGNLELKDDFNKYLEEIKTNGEFEKIINKYTKNLKGKKGIQTSNDVKNTDNNFVVATNAPFGPFEYKEKDGKIYGIDIEIAMGYAESRGLELIVATMDFEAIFTNVSSGYSDIGMAGITVSADRELSFEFTNTYYNASQVLIVSESNQDFDHCKTKEDVEEVLKSLKDEKIGYQTGTMGNWYIKGDDDFGFEGFANIEGVGNASLQYASMDVMNGSIYGVVTDELPAKTLVESASMGFSLEKLKLFISYVQEPAWQQSILNGIINTIIIAIGGILIGVILGIIIGIIRVAPKYKWIIRALDKICLIYVTIFRGTPTVVQLLLGYYVILPMLNISLPSVVVAIIFLGLNSGAYLSEMIRGGINSVDKGQLEASRALGLTYNTSMIKVVIPQAIKNIVPSIGNEFIALVKETSVVSFISVVNLTQVFTEMASTDYLHMFTSITMALIYIVIIVLSTIIVKLIERGFARSDKRN